MGVGLGDGSGDGLGEGLGDGDGLGGGGVTLEDGFALGDGAGAGGGGGGAATVCVGCWVNNEKSGDVKSCTARPATADDMKSCQISAGMVPPNTSDTPSTLVSDRCCCGHPTHTHATSCGTYPQNHAFV